MARITADEASRLKEKYKADDDEAMRFFVIFFGACVASGVFMILGNDLVFKIATVMIAFLSVLMALSIMAGLKADDRQNDLEKLTSN